VVIGACAFVLVFILIAPSSRAFIAASLGSVGVWLYSWAPLSFVLLTILLAAPIISVYLVKTWPVQHEPENPMAKYRREDVDD